MSEFNVGDRVKCLAVSNYTFCPCYGTVMQFVPPMLYRVKVDGNECSFDENGYWNFLENELKLATCSDDIIIKVRCVGYKQDKEKYFTLGKVYEWVNGTLINDNGDEYRNIVHGTNPAKWKLSEWYDFEVVTDENIEKHKNNMKVVITSDGKTTLARLYDGNKVVQKAEAVCSPDDPFNFFVGAKLAMERLIGNDEKKPTYFSGKAVCVEKNEHRAYTVGKVYEFKDGRVTIDNGNTIPCHPVATLEEFNNIGFSVGAKFIQLVE